MHGPPAGATPGEQISHWRGLKGWSQADLAIQIGLGPNSGALISRIESSAVYPHIDTIMRIAVALGETIHIPPVLPADVDKITRRRA